MRGWKESVGSSVVMPVGYFVLSVLLLESYDSVPFCFRWLAGRGGRGGAGGGCLKSRYHSHHTPTPPSPPIPIPPHGPPSPTFFPAHTTCLCFVLGGPCSYLFSRIYRRSGPPVFTWLGMLLGLRWSLGVGICGK